MEKKEKLLFLRNYKEQELINEVLKPLLEKMGFQGITPTHGPNEKGIDIVFSELNKFGVSEFTGMQVKAVNIHGSVAKKGNAAEILSQALLAFSHKYHDISDNKEKNIDRFIVLTSGKISPGARESIREPLKALFFSKPLQFIDGEKLMDLVDQWMPDFIWQKHNYFNNYLKAIQEEYEILRDISTFGHQDTFILNDIYVSLRLREQSNNRNISIESNTDHSNGPQKESKTDKLPGEWYVTDPDTAIKKFHRLVVLGALGVGKTTLLKHLVLKSCRENVKERKQGFIPLPITLREFSKDNKSIREYIDLVFAKYRFPNATMFVENALKNDRCLLLLDGFDELSSKEIKERVVKEVRAFVERYHECRVLITSRDVGYNNEITDFRHLVIMDFDDFQIKQFIEKWFGINEEKKMELLLQTIINNKNIKQLAKNPLMLSIISILYSEDKELPSRRAAVYERITEVLLKRRDIQKQIKSRFSLDKKEFILKKLAFHNHSHKEQTISRQSILDIITRYAPQIGLEDKDSDDFIDEICQRSYILRETPLKAYDFLHLSFQEYYTAKELEREDGLDTITKHLFEPWWEGPILLYAGIKKDAGPLIGRINKEVKDDIFRSVLTLSGKCIAEATFTDRNLKNRIIEKLRYIYYHGEYALLREKALTVLIRINPSEFRKELESRLSDKNSSIRREAVETLGIIGNTEYSSQLLSVLLNDESSSVRWSAANALGKIACMDTIPDLLDILTEHEKSSFRERAAFTLGIIGNPVAVPKLITALSKDPVSFVRGRAAEALGKIGGTKAVYHLRKALSTDKESSVRGYAAEALGEIGSDVAVDQLLATITNQKESNVRWRAASALGTIGNTDVIPILRDLLLNSEDSSVRWSAAYSLGKIGNTQALPELEQALTGDMDSSVRWRAAQALGVIGSPQSIQPLIRALAVEQVAVRGFATYALGKIGNPVVKDLLIKVLNNDDDSSVRWRAAQALGVIGTHEVSSHLIHALETDKDATVRGRAAESLGIIGNDEIILPLKNALKDNGCYHEGLKVKDSVFASLERICLRSNTRIIE